MMTTYEIEIGDNQIASKCDCCNKASYTGHGFVYKDDDAYAVYYASWSIHHSNKKISFALAIGNWDDNSTTNDRTCMGVEATSNGNEITFRIIEPAESPWAVTDLLGKILERKQVIVNPLKDEMFVIIENIVFKHSAINQYLEFNN